MQNISIHQHTMQEQTDIMMMREALREAEAAMREGEVPIGAVIAAGGKIIGKGHNQVERLQDATAHAEMIAITAATASIGGKYLRECTLYVTVEPCPMCAGALKWSQIGSIVYGCPDPQRGYAIYSPTLLHPATEIRGGVLEDECSRLLKGFFTNLRNCT